MNAIISKLDPEAPESGGMTSLDSVGLYFPDTDADERGCCSACPGYGTVPLSYYNSTGIHDVDQLIAKVSTRKQERVFSKIS